jgi:DsbC/DsbD-like thiol-disulfide interchange protein
MYAFFNAIRLGRVSRASPFLAAMALLCVDARAASVEGPAWSFSQSPHSRIRLFPMSVVPRHGAKLPYIGIEIEVEAGWKTYWRSPGEGIAPSFSWDESFNLKTAEVLWPAPRRYMDLETVSIGYEGRVVLPVVVTPQDPAKPVSLSLTVAYGVCKDICMPVETQLSLDMDAPVTKSDYAAFTHAINRVPRRQEPGVPCPHRFVSARLSALEGGTVLRVETAYDSEVEERDLLVEAPREAGVGLRPILELPPGPGVAAWLFPVEAEGVAALKGRPVTFTTVSDLGSCESTASVE